ncbi:ImmA/IrrE family metallo-endopeptidase [Maritalea sp.]|uniref:ImmA/IrrE family metallo-endopeptidase n=1 Tax=Maritalea sp. TaxID=2003361 RepID=UPI003EF867F9
MRGFSKAQFAQFTGLEPNSLGKNLSTEELSAKQTAAVSDVLGIPDFALDFEGEVAVKKLPTDFRTVGNRNVLLSVPALRAIYKTYGEASALVKLENDLGSGQENKPIPKFDAKDVKPKSVAKAMHKFLGTNLTHFASIEDELVAFKDLRFKIEKAGIYVFAERVADPAFRGYCFSEGQSSFLVVNVTNQPPRARIFTLAHELAHLFLGTLGIVDTIVGRRPLEQFCNKVVAEFLLPSEYLHDRLVLDHAPSTDDPARLVNWLHANFPFSKFFIAIRIQEVGNANFVEQWASQCGYQLIPVSFNLADIQEFSKSAIEFEQIGVADAIRRQGTVGYHNSRLGFNAIGIANLAIQSDLVSKFDLQRSLSMPANKLESIFDGHKVRINEARRYEA